MAHTIITTTIFISRHFFKQLNVEREMVHYVGTLTTFHYFALGEARRSRIGASIIRKLIETSFSKLV